MHPSLNQKKLEQQHEQSIMLAEGGIELVIGNNDASKAIDCRERSVEAGRQAEGATCGPQKRRVSCYAVGPGSRCRTNSV